MKEKIPIQPAERAVEERGDTVFEIKHRLGRFDVRLEVSKEGKPFESSVDLAEGKVEARLTPEGIKNGIEAVDDFLSRPDVSATIRGWTEKVKAARRKLREERVGGKTGAQQLLKEYAKQEGKTEAEILDELLAEIAQDSNR